LPFLSPDACRAVWALSFVATLAACSKPVAPIAPPPTASAAGAAPAYAAPREWVGVWTSTRGTVMRCIEMHADGTYLMVPNREAGDRQTYHGTWRASATDITWRDASQGDAPDVNRLVDAADGHFKTVETDQSTTQFDRLVADPGARCPA
jgi:hypothetical protein